MAETDLDLPSVRPVLCFTAKLSAPSSGLAFRDWSYGTTLITFDWAILPDIGNPNTLVCLDTGCGISLVDKTWLTKKHLSQKIRNMPVPLRVRGINASKYKLRKFPLTAFYIPGFDRGSSEIYAFIQYKLYLVKGLKANMLIGNNVLCTESFTINLISDSAHILTCGMTIVINARNHL